MDAQSVLAAISRFHAPLIMLFGVALVLTRAPGSGAGFIVGLVFSLVLVLQVIVRGAAAARAAFPPWAARLALGSGLVMATVGVGAPRLAASAQWVEAGAFLCCVAAFSLIVLALTGRVPAMLSDGTE
jgi:multisubunit Na+/H+ antiporter MnhB subunit